MTRGAMCTADGAASCAGEPAWRHATTKGAMKAPRTATAVTSARYNMEFNSARCVTRCDFRPCDFRPCDFRPCDFRPCDFRPCDFRPCDLGHCDLGPL